MNPLFKLAEVNAMVDLETLGTGGQPVITAIGAVAFGLNGLGAEFYARVCPESCARIGMTLDADTVLWWMKQSEAARLELTKPAAPIGSVLDTFTAWLGSLPMAPDVWGNGASADNVWLGSAFRLLGRRQPWPFWQDRCFRTVKAMFPDVPMARAGVHHNALDDAKSQALHLLNIVNPLPLAPAPVPEGQKNG